MGFLSGLTRLTDYYDQAELYCAAYICPELPGLDIYTVTKRVNVATTAYGLGMSSTRYYLGPQELGIWPIQGITALEVDGVDVTAGWSFDAFSIRPTPVGRTFAQALTPNSVVDVTLEVGFGAGKLPAGVRIAAEALGKILQDREGVLGVKRERTDLVETEYESPQTALVAGNSLIQALPAQVRAFLDQWRYREL